MSVKTKLGFQENEEFNLIKAIDYHLENKQKNTPKERDYFYASELGSSNKEIYDKIVNKKQFEMDAKIQRVFDNGNAVHERFFKYFAEMGILIASEIDVNIDLIHGRLDCIITDGTKNYIVDIKSMSQWSFQKLKEPSKNHIIQIQYYMYYSKIDKGILLYECKDNQQIRIFNIDLDKNLVESYIEELKKLKENIDNKIAPSDEPLIVSNLEYN